MAYTPAQQLRDNDKEDQQGQAPGAPAAPSVSGPSLGATSSVGGTVAGSSPAGQSNALAGKTAGTGFVNIDKYLGANQGASQQVQTAANKALGNDATAFETEAGKVKANVDAQKTPIVDPNKLVNDVVGGGGQAAIDTAKAALAAKFQGPSTVNYDVGNTGDVRKANAYGNAQSAGRQIATDNGTLGQYGTGLSAIDAAIYGSQGEAPTLKNIQGQTKGQVEGEIKQKGDIEAEAGETSNRIAKNAASTRAAFMAQANKLQGDAKTAADNANAASAAARLAKPADRVTQAETLADPTAGDYLAAGQKEDISLSKEDEQSASAAANAGHYSPEQYQALRQKMSDEKWAKRIGTSKESTSRSMEWASDLSPETQKKIVDLQAKYPRLTRDALVRLAKRPDPAAATTTAAHWTGGDVPATASNFLDANNLNNIGAVLGDQDLMNQKRGSAYAGPGKWEY